MSGEIEKGTIGSSFDDFLKDEGIFDEVQQKVLQGTPKDNVAESMIQGMKEAVEYAEVQNKTCKK